QLDAGLVDPALAGAQSPRALGRRLAPRQAEFVEQPVDAADHDADARLGIVAAAEPANPRWHQEALGALHRRVIVSAKRFWLNGAALEPRPFRHLKIETDLAVPAPTATTLYSNESGQG